MAKIFAMNTMPTPAMGRPKWEPTAPTTMPSRRRRARFPPSSPAIMASAVATPGGQAPDAGNSGVSYVRATRYMSTSIPMAEPMAMGTISLVSPITQRIPTDSSTQLAAPNPAAEVMVWTMFCLSSDLNLRMASSGTLAMAMATTAPMMEVFGVIPSLEMICMQMAPDRAAIATLRISVCGSRALT